MPSLVQLQGRTTRAQVLLNWARQDKIQTQAVHQFKSATAKCYQPPTKAFAIRDDTSELLPSASPLNEKFKILGTESMSSRKTEFRSLWLSMSCIFVLIRTQLRVHPDQATTRYNLANRYHMTQVFGTKRVPACRSDIQNQ